MRQTSHPTAGGGGGTDHQIVASCPPNDMTSPARVVVQCSKEAMGPDDVHMNKPSLYVMKFEKEMVGVKIGSGRL